MAVAKVLKESFYKVADLNLPDQFQTCIDECNRCAQACYKCFKACLNESDVAARKKCISTLVECT